MLRHTTFSSCGEVTTATIATAPKNTTSTTFRSISGFALPSLIHPDSQQPTSPIGPIGFLFLKLLPPPRAVLLARIWFFDSGKCFPTFLTETWNCCSRLFLWYLLWFWLRAPKSNPKYFHPKYSKFLFSVDTRRNEKVHVRCMRSGLYIFILVTCTYNNHM